MQPLTDDQVYAVNIFNEQIVALHNKAMKLKQVLMEMLAGATGFLKDEHQFMELAELGSGELVAFDRRTHTFNGTEVIELPQDEPQAQ